MTTIAFDTPTPHPDAFVSIDPGDSADAAALQSDFDAKEFSIGVNGVVDSTHPFNGRNTWRCTSDVNGSRDIDPIEFTESRGVHIRFPVRFDPDANFDGAQDNNIQLCGLNGGAVSLRFYPALCVVSPSPPVADSWALQFGGEVFFCARPYAEIANGLYRYVNLYAWFETVGDADILRAQMWWGTQRLFDVTSAAPQSLESTFNSLDVAFAQVLTNDDPESNPFVEVGVIDWVKDEDNPTPYSGLANVDGCLPSVARPQFHAQIIS